MGLFTPGSSNETTHDEDSVARVLALSSVDLSDDDKCLDVLVANGIYPWQFSGNWIVAKENARVIRKRRDRVAEAVRTASQTGAVLLTVFVLGIVLQSGLAYADDLAEHEAKVAYHLTRGALVIAFLFMAGYVVARLITYLEDRS